MQSTPKCWLPRRGPFWRIRSFDSATISLAVVDDDTIHELNRRHLDHDWPTDVLSFVLEDATATWKAK